MVEIVPATPAQWPAVQTLFEDHGERGCWCQYWRQSASTYHSGAPGSGAENLRRQVEAGPPPGMLALLGNEPVGWLGLWPRHQLERLVRSRTIPTVDDLPVWSIVCFLVRVGYRRKGVARALLAGAIQFARAAGVPALEAYPIDAQGRRVDVTFAYVGVTSLFESHGFRRVVETAAKSASRPRILMRLDLA